MLRWFAYGFAATLGLFAACALIEQIEQRT